MTPRALGLDLGGSRSKWHLLEGGTSVGSGSAPPITAALLAGGGAGAALTALVGALPARPDAVHAGLPGYGAGRADAERLRSLLAGALGVPTDRLTVQSDIELAHRAHFRPGEGVLLYAGTGSFACHVTADGRLLRAGGHGFMIDDEGGGFAMGRAALRWLTRQLDHGRIPSGPLADGVREITGGLDWDTLRAYTYGTPGARAVAALAPAVGRAADRSDPVALDILRGAAQDLAQLAAVVSARVDVPLQVAATGGALRVSERLPALLRLALPALRVDHPDFALCAARVAADLA